MPAGLELAPIIDAYLELHPEEADSLELLRSQITAGETLNIRKNFRGHACGSGIVLSPDGTSVLMIHHKIFDRWQQPGGHMEPNEVHPRDSARRESEEEAGVEIAEQLPVAGSLDIPLDIDTHYIAANPKKNEPEHYHHDFRYVFRAKQLELNHQAAEVHAAEWVPLDDPRTSHLGKVLTKLQRLQLI